MQLHYRIAARSKVVESVKVEPNPIRLSVLQSKSVAATALNGNGEEIPQKAATWMVRDGQYADLSVTGALTARITAKSIGSTQVTATIDGVTATAVVEIHPVTIAMSPVITTVNYGETTNISAIVRAFDNEVLTEGTVEWSSSNPAVASVTRTGSRTATITGHQIGTATITATIAGVSISTEVEVKRRVEITAPEYVYGASAKLTAAVYPSGNYHYTWEVSRCYHLDVYSIPGYPNRCGIFDLHSSGWNVTEIHDFIYYETRWMDYRLTVRSSESGTVLAISTYRIRGAAESPYVNPCGPGSLTCVAPPVDPCPPGSRTCLHPDP